MTGPALPAGTIRADGLGFTYPGATRPAFTGVTFELPAGGCLLIVGPSGSGKSTLAMAIAGLIPRDVAGTLVGSLEVIGSPAVVFQDPDSQLVLERVEDDVAFGLENLAWEYVAMHERVPAAIADVGLAGLERRRSRRLSGGQQQRLALAGALAPQGEILVLDEPTSNLDPDGTRELFDQIRALRRAATSTIVLVEHRVQEAWPLADVVVALDRVGDQVDAGEPGAVLERSAERLMAAGTWLPEPPIPAGSAARRRARSRAKATVVVPIDEPIIVVEGLRFGYEPATPVVRDVSLSIGRGERVALVGPNGGGKSTLGRLLVGLLRPDHGSVTLAGRDPARIPAADLARLAGYVFQDPESGFLADTVAEEVALGLSADELALMPAAMVGLGLPLEGFGSRSPYRLSGGEARRLSLATALVRDPAVLVLDEPTFGQDRAGYEALATILRDRSAAGMTLVVATHDERLVHDLDARVIEIRAGWVMSG